MSNFESNTTTSESEGKKSTESPVESSRKQEPKGEIFHFSSETLRMRMREWAAVFVLVVIAVLMLPRIWTHVDRFSPEANFRFPYELSNDYWFVSRWLSQAAKEFPYLVLGDSVVWGQYAGNDETLPAQLNKLLDREDFANIGVDGLHQAAMYGLLRYYGKDIRNTHVLIQLNPLWMSSSRHDLQGDEEMRFNHPGLVPQLFGRPPAYKPEAEERFLAVMERTMDFFAWGRHLRLAYFDNLDFHSWAVLNPQENPLKMFYADLPGVDEYARSRPVPWTQAGIQEQDFPWLPLEDSYQWQSFQEVIALLESRGNKVFVLLGPFNTHLMSTGSLERYGILEKSIIDWLQEKGLPYNATITIPSEEFGDASHPLAHGYELIAQQLLEDQAFQKWMK